MKFVSSIAVLIASMLMTFNAMGGIGSGGGGLGKTRLLLQSFTYSEAILAFDPTVNIPETETAPKLVIPADEYQELVAEVEKEVATGSKPFVLTVELKDGSVRNFTLRHVGVVGKEPLFLYLVEETEEEKDVE